MESIPGFPQVLAEIFIAETGGEMRQLGRAGHLARFVCFVSLDLWYVVIRVGP